MKQKQLKKVKHAIYDFCNIDAGYEKNNVTFISIIDSLNNQNSNECMKFNDITRNNKSRKFRNLRKSF